MIDEGRRRRDGGDFMFCPKCGKHLEIQFFDRGVQVMVDDVPDMTFPAKEEGTSMKEVKLNMPKR